MTPPTDAEIRDLIDAGRGIGLARPLAEEVLRLRKENADLAADRDSVTFRMHESGNCLAQVDAENAKLRELLVDLDLWGINHKALCAKVDETTCDCGADELQRRISEVTT